MRSSNKRSRNKNNRNRPSGGNIINRVFDSSGPEGKVRGTPQQIIDKYNQLTRDAQLSGDRVNAENFAQHAEHYTRMLAEAQREMDQKREQHEQQNQQRQQSHQNQHDNRQQSDGQQGGANRTQEGGGNRQGDGGQPGAVNRQGDGGGQPQTPRGQGDQPLPVDAAPAKAAADGGDEQPRKPRTRRKSQPRPDVIDVKDDDSSGLVETPENAPKPRRTRKPKAAPASEGDGGADSGESQVAE